METDVRQQPDQRPAESSVAGFFVPLSNSAERHDSVALEVLRRLRPRWRLLAIGTVIGAALGFGTSYLLPRIYRAEVVVTPASDEGIQSGGLGALAAQFGGLAGIAGVNLGGGERKEEAKAILRSRVLLSQFVDDRNLLPTLFANRWNPQLAKWKSSDVDDIPTRNDAVEYLNKRVLRISDDKSTGLTTVAVEWRDPIVAADWANALVDRLNGVVRGRDMAEAERNISYLTKLADVAVVTELRNGIYSLIESQTKRLMLARGREEYVFRIIDRASPPDNDDFVRPRRGLQLLLGSMAGLFIAAIASLLSESGYCNGRQVK
jgi:capsular polysaccharide biosynthesis protein